MIWATSPSQGTKLLVVSYLCALFQSTSFEEKVWGRGWKKFCRLSAQSFLQFHVWHNRLGRTRRKFEQRRNYCKFWKELFSKKCEARSIVLIKNRMGNQVLWKVSVYLLAEHWTSHAGSSSGGIFADLLHLLLLPLATPGCTCCTSQKVETTTTTVCCRLLQVTRLHMLHISNGNNNDSNRFLSRLKPQKEQQQQQQVYASLDRMQQAIQNVNWYCFTPVSDDGVSINYRMESARIENTKVL